MSLPATIKALQSQKDNTVKVIEIPFASQEKVKNLPPNEIIIKVRAVGINPTDWKHSIGGMWGEPGKIVGCDAAGDVVKVGSGVKHIKEGDRVFAFMHGTTQPDNGAYAEYARFSADGAAVIPTTMSYAEAAAFPIPHLTAVQALYFRLSLPFPNTTSTLSTPNTKPNFLVWGGSAAVGHHAIQLAKLSGYRVITTASKKNHDFLKSIGADVTIDYRDTDIATQLKDAVKDGGLKYAFDTVCDKGSTDIIIDTITDPNGHVATTLPTPPETTNRRPGVKVEFLLVYTLVATGTFKFGRAVDIAFIPEDHPKSVDWVSKRLPELLDGWVEGKGSVKYVGQKLKVGDGLEKIHEGLEYMKDGKVTAEKLVYNIA